jgi:8-oxo-dGTP pyrophosphatase MutT (NUDIX family)
VTTIRVMFVDTYVLRPGGRAVARPEFEVLALRRSNKGRCPGSWETVHGTIEPGETPVQASRREMKEETGLDPERVYNLSRVDAFYQHKSDEVALIPAFAAFVVAGAAPRLSNEHDQFEWLPLADAAHRFAWPREHRAVADILSILGGGDGGLLDDVLRVC